MSSVSIGSLTVSDVIRDTPELPGSLYRQVEQAIDTLNEEAARHLAAVLVDAGAALRVDDFPGEAAAWEYLLERLPRPTAEAAQRSLLESCEATLAAWDEGDPEAFARRFASELRFVLHRAAILARAAAINTTVTGN